jgi:ATPase subunit of ABC transporter with duplicated ATPase domains
VLGNVEEGVAATRALLARFEQLSARLGEAGPEEMDRLLEEFARVQDAIEAAGAWDLDAQLEMAMDAMRLPPVDTLRSLESALLDFPGCAVVISHDRWFLDRIATHMLAFEGDSRVAWFEGNFADYQADKVRRLGPEAARPHRVTYRKLVRD